jgi:hypothetical protein
LLEKAMKLMLTVIQVAQVRAIHNPHHSIHLLAIVSPIGSKCFLTTIIPYIEVKASQTKISSIHQKLLVLVVGNLSTKWSSKKMKD